ncbi:membrane protein [Actinoplanes lobatus]|uniref:Membrane protein n=1 Tax=Actinoplanes lobatus TaxID=113568 RepID=A0A7W7MJB8_9ACTN|nr:MMPL family transporter [Actinoplanes lobatus]MBB4752298.1 RND superfamily putative drug exporter [Actinoplanes lobatus]GGN94282.1 membrane protein [Actinoplanes lobatus]GIE45983.1 membrane protein [Actinoplanes lobatus]
MSTLLYRIGKAAYIHPWRFITAWLLAVAALAASLTAFPMHLGNEIRIDGTPAQQVIDDLAERLPEASGGQGIIAFRAPDGQRVDTPAGRRALLAAVDAVYRSEHVIDARTVLAAEAAKGQNSALVRAMTAFPAGSGPAPLTADAQAVPGMLVSEDGTAALFTFQFDVQTFELPTGTVDQTVEAAAHAVEGSGLTAYPSSTMVQVPEVVGAGEIIGVLVAAAVLVVTLGSVISAGLPLLSAFLGVGTGVGGALALSHLMQIHSLTVVLALMLGLAVGIDYALFIVNRQRRLILDQRLTAHEATGRAVGTAGNAVLFAGATVVIALVALLVIDITLLSTMALAAAATVILVVAASLTFLPALLGLAGERVCGPRARRTVSTRAAAHPVATSWARLLVRRRHVVAPAAVVVALALTVPGLSMRLGLPAGEAYDVGTPQRTSYEIVESSFGKGYNGPLIVSATSVSAQPIDTGDLAGLAGDLDRLDGVTTVALAGMDTSGRTAILTVIPDGGPNDESTADLVRAIRDRTGDGAAARHLTVGVTGFAALAIDISDRLADVLPVYLGVVLTLSLLVLLLVFRSVLVPVKATLGFLLSVAATFGVTTAVFQWGWLQDLLGMDATTPVLSILPIIATGVLYGLAMDYQVFLVSSMREARVHGRHGHDAVIHGYAQASRVVVAAAVIMTAVFAGFVFNTDPMIKQFGLALAAGIVVDAFLIRLTLVPALMAAFGDAAWNLPGPLARLLPDLDIEGDRLAGHLTRATPDAPPARQPAGAGTV